MKRHTLSDKDRMCDLGLARQLLSSLTVSLAPWRSCSTNPQKKLFPAHLPSTSPQAEQERRKGAAEQREGTFANPECPQSAPAPGNNFRNSSLAQQPWQRVPGLKSGEGPVVRKEHGTVCPRWERPRGRESGDVRSGPVLQRLLGLGSHRLLCGPEARARGSVSSLPNLDLVPPGYFESWSSLAFCRIWQTSVMG